jgi:hypothetical protein
MYDEYGREGRIGIIDVKGDGVTMEWLKTATTGVVDKYKSLNLFLVGTLWSNRDKSNPLLDRNG